MQPFYTLPSSGYFGGKNAPGIVHRIIQQIPKHDRFISGFLGHCAVMRWKLPALQNIGFDLNPDTIECWRLAKRSEEAGHIALYCADYLGFKMELYPTDFVYLDPPYLHSTRKSSKRYPFELSDEMHRSLLARFSDASCMVAISCYDSPLYSAMLPGWRKIQFEAITRSGKKATETLYMNYPEPWPSSLHDARFSGTDFRAREKSKRRVRTISQKIARLDTVEQAQLFAMLQKNKWLATMAEAL